MASLWRGWSCAFSRQQSGQRLVSPASTASAPFWSVIEAVSASDCAAYAPLSSVHPGRSSSREAFTCRVCVVIVPPFEGLRLALWPLACGGLETSAGSPELAPRSSVDPIPPLVVRRRGQADLRALLRVAQLERCRIWRSTTRRPRFRPWFPASLGAVRQTSSSAEFVATHGAS